jgi:Ras-related GTP-binding protein C/D
MFNLQSSSIEKAFLFDSYTKISLATDSSPVDIQSYELCSDMIDVMMDLEAIYTPECHHSHKVHIASSGNNKINDRKQGSVIRLSSGIILALVQMEKVSLVCLLRAENYDEKAGLLGFNFQKFREALWLVFSIPQSKAR